MSFELVMGSRWMPIVGGYIPTTNLTTLPHISMALARFSTHWIVHHLVLLGDLNVDLADPERDARGSDRHRHGGPRP